MTNTPPTPDFSHQHLHIKRCKHGFFAYNTNDSFVGTSLDLYGEWAETELEILTQVIRPGNTILDIGAYIGTHTLFFSQKVGPSGMVYAFEPQRLAYYNLCTNITLNHLTNVSCVNAVISQQSGQTPVPLLDQHHPQNFGALHLKQHHQGISTPTFTIDQLQLPQVHLIKIDVEQMEPEVLAGAAQTIATHRPILFIENNTSQLSPSIISSITSYHYHCWWHIASYYNPHNYFKNPKNIFKIYAPEANLLCIPQEKSTNIQGLEPLSGPTDDWQQAHQRLVNHYEPLSQSPRTHRSSPTARAKRSHRPSYLHSKPRS